MPFDNDAIRLTRAAPALLRACRVISLDRKINAWLAANDPTALHQVRHAIALADGTAPFPTERLISEYERELPPDEVPA